RIWGGLADKPFAPRSFDRAGKANLLSNDLSRAFDRAAAEAIVQIVHPIEPYRRCSGDAGNVAHRRAGRIPHPHRHREAIRVADAPVVAHILAGAGFHGAPVARSEAVLEAKGRATARPVSQYI